MTNQEILTRLVSNQEKDEAEFEAWWESCSPGEHLAIQKTITKHYADPNMEIMSRLAQFAYEWMLLKRTREKIKMEGG